MLNTEPLQTHTLAEQLATMSKSWTETSWLSTSVIGRRAKNEVSQSSSSDGTRVTAGVVAELSFSDDFSLNLPDVSSSISSLVGPDRFGVDRAAHSQ